jgi:osmotically-inducible protein OsmY
MRLTDTITQHFAFDPAVDDRNVTVTVADGLVTLAGFVQDYPAKLAAEKAARRVHGVRGVTNRIEVRLAVERTDEDVADDAAQALRLHGTVPESVRAEVTDGHVRLVGNVDWPYQKRSAVRAVREIRGVRDVVCALQVLPRAEIHDLRRRIARVLRENADVDARQIAVKVVRDCATLTGKVGSWLQREAAERAAADAAGIRRVDNRLVVEPPAWATSDQDELC